MKSIFRRNHKKTALEVANSQLPLNGLKKLTKHRILNSSKSMIPKPLSLSGRYPLQLSSENQKRKQFSIFKNTKHFKKQTYVNKKFKLLKQSFASIKSIKNSFQLEKNLPKIETKDFLDLNLTTKSWCLYDQNTNKTVGFRSENKREIASLTKIMTTILAIETMECLDLKKNCLVRITETATKMIGTTADLRAGCWICLQDLLYGVMLPSGNDAAYTLAQYMGYFMIKTTNKNQAEISKVSEVDLTQENTFNYVIQFIRQMNQKAQSMNLISTRYSNPHGLQNAMNSSSAHDIIELSVYCTKNAIFREVMNSVYYKYSLFQSQNIQRRQFKRWWNTNKLLCDGWEGIKTGQTIAAGSCLASLKSGIYIVVLNCSNGLTRFTETQKIYQKYMSYLKVNDEQLIGCVSSNSFSQISQFSDMKAFNESSERMKTESNLEQNLILRRSKLTFQTMTSEDQIN